MVQTIPSKPLVPTDSARKAGGSHPITNGHRTNQNSTNKGLVDTPNNEIILNHLHVSSTRTTGETKNPTKPTKHVNDDDHRKSNETLTDEDDDQERNTDGRMDPEKNIIPNKNDTAEQVRLSDKNGKKFNLKGKSRFDYTK